MSEEPFVNRSEDSNDIVTTVSSSDTPDAVSPNTPSGYRLPNAIGKYRILRLLGQGGMGVVYEAQQEEPQRNVALKLIKAGLGSPELLHRFKQEAQALARLQHPGIAQIYEVGSADGDSGPRPYFAMEFIEGQSLLDYVETHRLNTPQRMELMAKVCDAVHHAHQRGLIHRDLKPANILVDTTGQPKILDFGVARLTDTDAEATLQTVTGQIMGTLAYMSPEQVSGDPLDIDSRTDIYALGVILYEILGERPPYSTSAKLQDALQTIREADPALLGSVNRLYRGDVETIVAKTLEKDKSRRYASAAELAQDIRHHLHDEPISARPAKMSYQLYKFGRRHKTLVGGLAFAVIILVAGTVISTWQALRARRAEQAALLERDTATAISDFLQNDLLGQASAINQARPDVTPDPDLKVRTALDRAASRVEGKFKLQPLVEASIRQTMGAAYIDLGFYPEAQKQLDRALELRRRLLGETHPDTLNTERRLANNYVWRGQYSQAELLFVKVLETQRRTLGEDHRDALETMQELADVYTFEGKYGEAETLQIKVLNSRRTLGEEHPDTLQSMYNLAWLYSKEGKYAQAEPLFVRVLELRGRVLGEEHPSTFYAVNELATIRYRRGDFGKAEPLFVRVLEFRRRVLGDEHSDTLLSMNNLAMTYRSEGKYAQAEPLLRKTLEVRRRILGDKHPLTVRSLENLGTTYLEEEKYSEAEPILTQAFDSWSSVLGKEHPDTLAARYALARLYDREGQNLKAKTLYTQALESRRHVLGEDHPDTLSTMIDLASLMVFQARYSDAEPLLIKASNYYEQHTPDDWRRYNAQNLLGAASAGRKNFVEAERLLISGYEGMLQRQAAIPAGDRYQLERARERIVHLYQAWNKPEKQAEWRENLSNSNQAIR